jgi:hypothetical protein
MLELCGPADPASGPKLIGPHEQVSRLWIGRRTCRTDPQSLAYVWAVTRKAWFADWQHDGGFAPSLAEAMHQAETALKRVAKD